jgi:hypothetical protein
MGNTMYVRKLRSDDVFIEDNEVWQLSRLPEVEGGQVKVYAKPIDGKRSRAYVYDFDARVKLAPLSW